MIASVFLSNYQLLIIIHFKNGLAMIASVFHFNYQLLIIINFKSGHAMIASVVHQKACWSIITDQCIYSANMPVDTHIDMHVDTLRTVGKLSPRRSF